MNLNNAIQQFNNQNSLTGGILMTPDNNPTPNTHPPDTFGVLGVLVCAAVIGVVIALVEEMRGSNKWL